MRFRATIELGGSTATGFVMGIEQAKKPETRARRVEKAVERLREGRGRR